MWRSIASNALTLMAVGLFLMAGLILWGQAQYRAEGPLEQAMCLKVDRGSNFTRVSEALAEDGAVSNPMILRLGADYSGKSDELKAGSFLVRPGASMEEIVDSVTRSGASTCGSEIVYRVGVTRTLAELRELDPETERFVERASFEIGVDTPPADYLAGRADPNTRYRISVAEGVTSWQVAEALNAVEVLSGDIAEVPGEGTLAPDSYDIVPGRTRAEILEEMRQEQEVRVAAAWASREDGLPVASAQELLILASIIEKETGVPQERGQVASVFVNRLNQGMRLQTDPTVIYGITKGQSVLGRGLRQSELRRATPWNTYVIDGLPPTPIANPGEASLLAAANPEETPFVFFVADGTGGHAFSETLEEHNRNVARWRAIEAERANN
jgi:UPF0755 protein